MKSLNEQIKNTKKYTHSLKFLQDLIVNIEAYPELNKAKSKKASKKKYDQEQHKISQSTTKELNEYLEKLKKMLNQKFERNSKKNIEDRLEILKIDDITHVYLSERKLKDKELSKVKNKIKKELLSLDKSLKAYVKVSKKDGIYSLTEDLNHEETVEDIFKKISVIQLAEDLDLEEYKKEYYQELAKVNVDVQYELLFKNSSKGIELKRKEKYPNIEIAELLIKINNSDTKLLSNCQKVADKLIQKEKLDNLKSCLIKNDFKYTIDIVDKKLNELEKKRSDLEDKVVQQIRNEIAKINIEKKLLEKDYNVTNLVNMILKEIKGSTNKIQFYQIDYYEQDLAQGEQKRYQYEESLLKKVYNIQISPKRLETLLNSQPTETKEKYPRLNDRAKKAKTLTKSNSLKNILNLRRKG